MAISPLEMNGMYSRTQDFTVLKQNEDNKAMLGQNMIQTQVEKQQEQKANVVVKTNESETHQQRQDAREKGKNEYMGDGGKRRKKPQGDGSVSKKAPLHFDMSI